MKVCVCDRCGREVQLKEIKGKLINRSVQIVDNDFDLDEGDVLYAWDICDDCYDSFKQWFRRWQKEEPEC